VKVSNINLQPEVDDEYENLNAGGGFYKPDDSREWALEHLLEDDSFCRYGDLLEMLKSGECEREFITIADQGVHCALLLANKCASDP